MNKSKSRKTQEQQHFSKQQLNLLKSKPWWIASTETPHLIKFSISQSSILMKCTNLTHLFVKRFNQSQIRSDQQAYAKGLTVKDFKHLLQFFEGYLSNRDQKAKYWFNQNHQEGWIDFKFQKLIEFFPFVWKFRLYKVQYDIKELICTQIINPLSFALQRQTRRHQVLRKKSEYLQKQLVKKMTETQKKMYKPLLLQTEEQWKSFTKKQEGLYNPNGFNRQMLFSYSFDGFVAFAIKEYMKPFIEQKPKVQIQALLQARNNISVAEKSSNSKSRPLPIYNDEEDEMQFKLKYTKQDEKKAKNMKKKDKSTIGIDFL